MKLKIFNLFLYYLFFFVISFSIAIYVSFSLNPTDQQFSEQAQSFLRGRTDISKSIDTIDVDGKHYWPQNPFPSILLLPGQMIIGPLFNQDFGQAIVIIFLIVFVYKLARLKKFNHESAVWLTFVFLFGSVMINLISQPRSWYFSQVIAATLLAGTLFEYETKRRYWILGLLLGCIIATRPTAAFIGLMIIWKLLRLHIYKLLFFLLPVFITIMLLLLFNYLRFNNPFFNTYQAANNGELFNSLKERGIFSFYHIPSSLYYYFLAGFVPVTEKSIYLVFPYITYSSFGLSFFIVSPFFAYAFRNIKYTLKRFRGYWVIIILTLICLLSYFNMGGFTTFGPRYTADFLPILYLVTLNALKPPLLSGKQKIVIITSALLNTYLLFTHIIY